MFAASRKYQQNPKYPTCNWFLLSVAASLFALIFVTTSVFIESVFSLLHGWIVWVPSFDGKTDFFCKAALWPPKNWSNKRSAWTVCTQLHTAMLIDGQCWILWLFDCSIVRMMFNCVILSRGVITLLLHNFTSTSAKVERIGNMSKGVFVHGNPCFSHQVGWNSQSMTVHIVTFSSKRK